MKRKGESFHTRSMVSKFMFGGGEDQFGGGWCFLTRDELKELQLSRKEVVTMVPWEFNGWM